MFGCECQDVFDQFFVPFVVQVRFWQVRVLPYGINVYGGGKEENVLLVELCISKIRSSDEILD